MANKNPSIHTRFKPGQSGNKSGKPKGLLTRDKVNGTISNLYAMSKEQLRQIIESPKSTMLQIHIASIIANGTKKGCTHALEGLLQRSIGRIKDEAEIDILGEFNLAYKKSEDEAS
jgi:uncharacterized protein YjbJ (UPF0337 family)